MKMVGMTITKKIQKTKPLNKIKINPKITKVIILKTIMKKKTKIMKSKNDIKKI